MVGLAVFVLLQLVPYGRDHGTPIVEEVDPLAWPTADAEDAFIGACADCHSNDTEWPWYSNVAPVSWMVQHDVDEGRGAWNVSEGDAVDEAEDAIELIESGDMPPFPYPLAHPDAELSDEEKAALIAALEQLDEGSDDRGSGNDEDDEEEDRGSNSGPG
jgi:mono/diheme cytochrome c family protein